MRLLQSRLAGSPDSLASARPNPSPSLPRSQLAESPVNHANARLRQHQSQPVASLVNLANVRLHQRRSRHAESPDNLADVRLHQHQSQHVASQASLADVRLHQHQSQHVASQASHVNVKKPLGILDYFIISSLAERKSDLHRCKNQPCGYTNSFSRFHYGQHFPLSNSRPESTTLLFYHKPLSILATRILTNKAAWVAAC